MFTSVQSWVVWYVNLTHYIWSYFVLIFFFLVEIKRECFFFFSFWWIEIKRGCWLRPCVIWNYGRRCRSAVRQMYLHFEAASHLILSGRSLFGFNELHFVRQLYKRLYIVQNSGSDVISNRWSLTNVIKIDNVIWECSK